MRLRLHLQGSGDVGGVHPVLWHHVFLPVGGVESAVSDARHAKGVAEAAGWRSEGGVPPPLFTRSGSFRKAPQPAVQFQIRVRVGDGVCTVMHLQFNLIRVIPRPHQVVFLILLANPNVTHATGDDADGENLRGTDI
jgi:hypothetical protein